MEEISTRFKIIELAIKLGDRDTIDIQARKLRDISIDDNLDEIISLLESNNFRQALFLMKNYSNTLKDNFFLDEDEQEDIETKESQQIPCTNSQSGIKIITVEDLLKLSDRSKESIAEYDNSPAPKEEESKEEDDDILNIDSTYSNYKESNETNHLDNIEPIYEPSYNQKEDKNIDNPLPEPIYDYQPAPTFELDIDEDKNISSDSSINLNDNINNLVDETIENSTQAEAKEQESTQSNKLPDSENETYPPMPHIELKFKNMLNQYPPLESSDEMAPEIYPMIDKISQDGYSEQDIWDFLDIYHKYKDEGNKAYAAQILLLAAATESKFAQFLLARELFSGDVIEKDHGEAFTQIKLLAEKNFPEAICDLGQFYEYGIGIDKDKKMALILYEEAAELGVERAARHVNRLKNSKGIFKFFKF